MSLKVVSLVLAAALLGAMAGTAATLLLAERGPTGAPGSQGEAGPEGPAGPEASVEGVDELEDETSDLRSRTEDLEAAVEALQAPRLEGSDPDVVADLESLAISIEELQVEQEADCDVLGATCSFVPPLIFSTPER